MRILSLQTTELEQQLHEVSWCHANEISEFGPNHASGKSTSIHARTGEFSLIVVDVHGLEHNRKLLVCEGFWVACKPLRMDSTKYASLYRS
jgi:hypothetical protein